MSQNANRHRNFNIISHQNSNFHSWAKIRPSFSLKKSEVNLTASRPKKPQFFGSILTKEDQARRRSRNLRNVESQKLKRPRKEFKLNYDRQLQTRTLWDERPTNNMNSLFNSSSKNYNFIMQTRHRPAASSQSIRRIPKVANRKKAITELSDLGRLYNPNPHPEYQKIYKKRPIAFRKLRGRFSGLLDDANKAGSLSKPFQKFKVF